MRVIANLDRLAKADDALRARILETPSCFVSLVGFAFGQKPG